MIYARVLVATPFLNESLDEATALTLWLLHARRAYVGDNRWCDDWDYTCTVGATQENATEAQSGPPMNRRTSAQFGHSGSKGQLYAGLGLAPIKEK